MFRGSIFNYYSYINGNTIIFNSLTENVVCIHGILILNSETLITFFTKTKKNNQQSLLQYGIVVKREIDENRIASVKLFDRIANKDLYLMILPTYECNFRCKYCYENECKSKDFEKINISEKVQNRIIQYVKNTLRDYHCLFVEWHGGEPLKEIEIINNLSDAFANVAGRLGKPYVASLTTNGFYLTEEVFKKMLKNHVIKFHVTIDGFAWNHDYYRPGLGGTATYSKVMNNLLNIKKNINCKNFHIVLRTNVTQKFLPYLNEWLQYLSESFSDDSRFQLYVKMVEDKGGNAIKKINGELLESEEEMYSIIANSKYYNNFEYYYSSICNATCSAAMRNKYIIAPEGKIKKCGHYLFDKRTDVGVLGEDSTIYYNRDAFSKWICVENRSKNCDNCALWAACFNSFCPFRAGFSGLERKAICSGEHQNIEQILNILVSPYNTKQSYLKHIYA